MKYLFILSLITISVFAFSPGQNTPVFIAYHDKAAHALTFFILSFLMHRSFSLLSMTKIIMFMISLGIAIELIQLLFTSREFSLEDLMYDAIGMTMYITIHSFTLFWQRSKEKI